MGLVDKIRAWAKGHHHPRMGVEFGFGWDEFATSGGVEGDEFATGSVGFAGDALSFEDLGGGMLTDDWMGGSSSLELDDRLADFGLDATTLGASAAAAIMAAGGTALLLRRGRHHRRGRGHGQQRAAAGGHGPVHGPVHASPTESSGSSTADQMERAAATDPYALDAVNLGE